MLGGGIYNNSSAAPGGNVYSRSAASMRQAGNDVGIGSQLLRHLQGYDPATMTAATGRAPTMAGVNYVDDPDAIATGINRYMNPYTNQVINRSIADIDRTTQLQQNRNYADAVAAGAFGGSRHGLVEATTNAEAARAIGDMASGLRHQGFTTAADLSARDIGNDMTADAFNASADNARRLAHYQGRLAVTQQNVGNRQQAATANMDAENEAAQYNRNLRMARASGLLGTAGEAASVGKDLFNIGNTISGQQASEGAQQQGIVQQILNNAMTQFGNYTGQGKSLVDLINSSLGISPLNNARTQTSQYTPGLFDYLGLGAGVASGKGGRAPQVV